jgi:hypothetical protein
VIRANPSTSFPEPILTLRNCHPEIAAQIGLGITRCQTGAHRLENPGGFPLDSEQSSDSDGLVCDMGALMRALICCYPITENAKPLALEEWAQLEPQGGVVGGEWTAYILADLYCEATSPGDSP